MLAQLGSLFKTTFRQAENADARLEIRRHEKDDHRRKEDEGGAEEDAAALWEDTTSVSTEALRAFLIEFLKSQSAPVPASARRSGDDFSPSLTPPPEARAPSSPIAAQAMRAYGAAQGGLPESPPPALPPVQAASSSQQGPIREQQAPPEDAASSLSGEEIRTIHHLIAALDDLARGGVQILSLDLSEATFLEAAKRAVMLATHPSGEGPD